MAAPSARPAAVIVDVQEVQLAARGADDEANDADGAAEFAFMATFDVMKTRQGTRRSAFAYVMQRPGTTVYLLSLVWVGACACVGVAFHSSHESSSGESKDESDGWSQELLGIFLPTLYAVLLLILQLLPAGSIVIFIEHIIMVEAFATGVAFLFDGNRPETGVNVLLWSDRPFSEFYDRSPALITFLVVFRLYMLYILYVNLVVTPFVQRRLTARGSAAWAIEPLTGQPGQFTYRRAVRWWEPWWVFRGGRDFWWFVRGRLFGGEGRSIKSFQFVGELDMQGRPHGRGRWTDTHPFGVRRRRCVERALLPPHATSSPLPRISSTSASPLPPSLPRPTPRRPPACSSTTQSPRPRHPRSTLRVCGSTASRLVHF